MWTKNKGKLRFNKVCSNSQLSVTVYDQDRRYQWPRHDDVFRIYQGSSFTTTVTFELEDVAGTTTRLCLAPGCTAYVDFSVSGQVKSIDCEVSQWSEWSTCTCGGVRSRSRTIITAPTSGGDRCPSLKDTGTCVAPSSLDFVLRLVEGRNIPDLDSRDTTSDIYARLIVDKETQFSETLNVSLYQCGHSITLHVGRSPCVGRSRWSVSV